MKNIPTFDEHVNESNESNESINEGISGYGKDIWNNFKPQIFKFIKDINEDQFSGEDGAMIADELSKIFKEVSKNEAKYDKEINKV